MRKLFNGVLQLRASSLADVWPTIVNMFAPDRWKCGTHTNGFLPTPDMRPLLPPMSTPSASFLLYQDVQVSI